MGDGLTQIALYPIHASPHQVRGARWIAFVARFCAKLFVWTRCSVVVASWSRGLAVGTIMNPSRTSPRRGRLGFLFVYVLMQLMDNLRLTVFQALPHRLGLRALAKTASLRCHRL